MTGGQPFGSVPPPARAPVVPRVRVSAMGAAQPLHAVVERLIKSQAKGRILLLGIAGSGKSTALADLRAVLPDTPFDAIDDFAFANVPPQTDPLLIVASREDLKGSWLLRAEMAGWNDDDCIEYLLSVHRDRCASVMNRLRADDRRSSIDSPLIWRIVLDAMAADEKLATSFDALRRHLDSIVTDEVDLRGVTALCAQAVREGKFSIERQEVLARLSDELKQLLAMRVVQVIFAGRRIATSLADKSRGPELANPLPPDLVREAAAQIRARPKALKQLHRHVGFGAGQHQGSLATLLLAAEPTWKPKNARCWHLAAAQLAGAVWPGVDLRKAHLQAANLNGADLRGADLSECIATDAKFRKANLREANLSHFYGDGCDFAGADLSDCKAGLMHAARADFTSCRLERAALRGARLESAILRGAHLINADLRQVFLSEADLEDADIFGCRMAGAILNRVRIRQANWSGTTFAQTRMIGCDLEAMRLFAADFSDACLKGSLLTGSSFRRANFRRADLTDTGLAEIDWPDADLRDADLTGASFHLGSSRSGLVDSVIASEGTRTGFYTDDYNDQDFKRPEEIRKANLCGADLRGANITDVDFYLVDLRGAKYTQEQGEHFARCGAILHARVA